MVVFCWKHAKIRTPEISWVGCQINLKKYWETARLTYLAVLTEGGVDTCIRWGCVTNIAARRPLLFCLFCRRWAVAGTNNPPRCSIGSYSSPKHAASRCSTAMTQHDALCSRRRPNQEVEEQSTRERLFDPLPCDLMHTPKCSQNTSAAFTSGEQKSALGRT